MVIVTVEIEYVPPKAIFTSYIGCSVELWLFVKQHLLVVDATDRQVLPRKALRLKMEETFIIFNICIFKMYWRMLMLKIESAISQLSTL